LETDEVAATPQPSDRKGSQQNATWALFQVAFLMLPEQLSNYSLQNSAKLERVSEKIGLLLQRRRNRMSK
jgi:hypothetical protein